MSSSILPVAIIGAGPIGLAAAAHLARRKVPWILFEAGHGPGTAVAQWAHVAMFSPWKYNLDDVGRALLEEAGWEPPEDEALPTGRDLLEGYLEPLAAHPALRQGIAYRHRVESVGRRGFDRLWSGASGERGQAPFDLILRGEDGHRRLAARAVIDASGTWATPNPLGMGGRPAPGEGEAADQIFYRIPEVEGWLQDRFADRQILVVGGGDSAFTSLEALARLQGQHSQTRILWAIRSSRPSFGGGSADKLPHRKALGTRISELVSRERVRLTTDFQVARVEQSPEGLRLQGPGGELTGIDAVIAATGFRPDLDLTRELRLDLDLSSESVAHLGPLIDPNFHSCGSVPPHGAAELRHPEEGFFSVGMKSYGRAPTFLLRTGYEQVRSVVAALAGDGADAAA